MSTARPNRRVIRRVALVVVGAVVVAGAYVGVSYRHQIVSYLTHRKGGPDQTVAWVPYPVAPELHLAVTGDTGDAGDRLDATGRAMAVLDAGLPYDDLLLLGDLVYPSGDPDRVDDTVYRPFADVLDAGTDLLAILGNHDVKDGHGTEIMEALQQTGRRWARQEGDVLLVGLDSTRIDDPAQVAWLERTLAETDATWKIVALHHPPYSAGYQGSSLEARTAFAPIFERHGVQLVLSGHDHDYQRSEPLGGVTYVVTGAGAGVRGTGEESFTAVSYAWRHFVDLAVFPDRLVLRAVGQDGRVADEATIAP